MEKSFKIYTFGCRTNQEESDYIVQELKKIGFSHKGKNENTDYTIINSCSVTSVADDEILYLIRKQKKNEPDTKVILTGCLAQADGEKLADNSDIYMILGNSEKLHIADFLKNNDTKFSVKSLMDKSDFDEFQLDYSTRTRATVKIQDGCNNFCSYCIVPFTRGKSRSSKKENVIANIKNYVEHGYKEVVLSGIHLGLWGKDFATPIKFVDLLKEIEQIEGLCRYRLGSFDPGELDDELMEFIISSEKLCHHMHISLQSATDKTLKNMNRHYTVNIAKQRINELKENVKNINIGADIIVGFPMETDEDFMTTYENISCMPLTYAHVFPYSQRNYTKAAGVPEQVPQEIKKQRALKLRTLVNDKQNEFLNSLIGKPMPILIEKTNPKKNLYKGLADNYVKFIVESDNDIRNNIVEIHASSVSDKKMFAKINN